MINRCKATVKGTGYHRVGCDRKATKDGYCWQHHPDKVAERLVESADKYAEELAKRKKIRDAQNQYKADLEELYEWSAAKKCERPLKHNGFVTATTCGECVTCKARAWLRKQSDQG